MDAITNQLNEISELLNKNKWGHTDKSVSLGTLYLFSVASLMESEEADANRIKGLTLFGAASVLLAQIEGFYALENAENESPDLKVMDKEEGDKR